MGDRLGGPVGPLTWGRASPDSMTGSAVFQNPNVSFRALLKPSHSSDAADSWDISAEASPVRNTTLVLGGRCGVWISEAEGQVPDSEVAWMLRTWGGGAVGNDIRFLAFH